MARSTIPEMQQRRYYPSPTPRRCKQCKRCSEQSSHNPSRVAQQNNNGTTGFVFELPEEVLEEREKAWDSYFKKYEEEASDEIILDIGTMEPVMDGQDSKSEDDNDNDLDDLEDNEDEQHKEYYSQCRGPMRKLPALIQYWVDTGNPPYQLVGEDDISETGSSLSEGEHSRSGQLAVLREFSDKQHKIGENSPCSSVDTAAYILSNTNITKKAETVAILEAGAKNSKKTIGLDTADPIDKSPGQVGDKKIAHHSIVRDESLNVDNVHESNPGVLIMTKVVTGNESILPRTRGQSTPLKNFDSDPDDEIFSPNKESKNTSTASQQSSVKLSEVLPAIQQFDELMEKQQVTHELPITRSALSKVRRKRKPIVDVESSESKVLAESQGSSANSSQNGTNKVFNRRKLYTGRNSPIDLIVARTSTDNTIITGQSLHPALYPPDGKKNTITISASRLRAKRKRKRATERQSCTNDESHSQNENTRQILDRASKRQFNNDKGYMRYTDFFESLGLTPSKTIIEKAPLRDKASKRMKKMARRKKRENSVANNLGVSTESSNKETQNVSRTSNDFVLSPELIANSAKLLGDKVARVQVVRLSDKSLARYDRRESSSSTEPQAASPSTSARNRRRLRRSASKKECVLTTQNIELLTTITHDSDSSTILICSCNNNNNNNDNSNNNNDTNNDEYSASNCSFLTVDSMRDSQNESPIEKNILSKCQRKNESGEDVATSTEKSNIEDLSKFQRQIIDKTNVESEHGKEPNTRNSRIKIREITNVEKSINAFVRLEKLNPESLPQLTSSKTTDSLKTRTIFRHKRQVRRVDGKFASSCSSNNEEDLDGSCRKDSSEMEAECITIGSRIFGESSKMENEKKIKKNTSACRVVDFDLGMSLSLLEKDDDFVKLLQRVGSTKLDSINSKKSHEILVKDANQDKTMNRKKLSMPVKRRLGNNAMEISSISSDSENDQSVNLRQEAGSKRRRRKTIDRKICQRVSERIIGSVGSDVMRNMESDCDDSAMPQSRVDESDNRDISIRKKIVNNDQQEDKTNNQENSLRRSSRMKLIPSHDARNIRTNYKFPSREGKIHRESSDEKSHRQIAQNEKKRSISPSKDVISDRSFTRDEERSNMPRFQTKLVSNSDSDFEEIQSSPNDPYNSRLIPSESIKKDILLNNRAKRMAKRRNVRSQKKIDEDVSDDNAFSSQRYESVEKLKSNDRFSLQNKTELSNGKTKKRNESNDESNVLALKIIARSPIKNQINEESRVNPIMRKKLASTKIIGTPMEYEESDDGGESMTGSKSNFFTRSTFKNAEKDNDGSLVKSRQDCSKHLFSNILDDTLDGVDLIFGKNGNSRLTRSKVLNQNLNFVSPKAHDDNITNTRQSTITFRTRLAIESDEDNLL